MNDEELNGLRDAKMDDGYRNVLKGMEENCTIRFKRKMKSGINNSPYQFIPQASGKNNKDKIKN
ncbi:MAG: hypothetical protein MI892_00585 [Desulfobacterales bacterium]|nr:hypothetical protein [Desulfobacterales bacterium]